MLVTKFGIVIDVNDVQPWKAFVPMSTSVEDGANVTDAKEVQLSNAYSPMLVTEFGIVIDVKFL